MLAQYLKTRVVYYLGFMFIAIILLYCQVVFSLDKVVIWAIIISMFVTMTVIFAVSYIAIEHNFRKVRKKLNSIENPQLITYYLTRPSHFESGYLYDMLDQIAQSLYHKYKLNVDNQIEYQEYLLLLIHDLKLPIQNLKLTADSQSLSEISSLETLVDNLLNFSKISLQTVDLKITKVNLQEVINSIIKSNFDLILDKQIQISTEFVDATISSDGYWINFVIKQLVNNAIRYCDRLIVISIVENQNQIVIKIANDGKLIRSDELVSIFEKGYTGSNASFKSTGYGLYYSSQIASKLGCELDAEINQNLNTFKITFNK